MFRDELDEDVRFLIVSKMKSFPRQQLLGKTWFRVLRTNPFDMAQTPYGFATDYPRFNLPKTTYASILKVFPKKIIIIIK